MRDIFWCTLMMTTIVAVACGDHETGYDQASVVAAAGRQTSSGVGGKHDGVAGMAVESEDGAIASAGRSDDATINSAGQSGMSNVIQLDEVEPVRVPILGDQSTIDISLFIEHESTVSEIVSQKMTSGSTDPMFTAIDFRIDNQSADAAVRIIESTICQTQETIASVNLMRVFISYDGREILSATTVDVDGCWKLVPTSNGLIIPVGDHLKMRVNGELNAGLVNPTNATSLMTTFNVISSYRVLSCSSMTFASTSSPELLTIK